LEDLARIFLTQFLASRTRKRPSGFSLTLQQHSNKTLKEFIARFNLEKITVEDPTDDMFLLLSTKASHPRGP